jgi:hypothetical protein
MTFPDPNWQKRITIGGGINAFLFFLCWGRTGCLAGC